MKHNTHSGDTNIRQFDTIDERDLHAYVDGRLDARRSRQVEAYLARHPEISAEIQDYIAYNDLLGSVDSDIVQAPVPPHLLNTLRQSGKRTIGSGMIRAAAVIVLCLLSASGGWIAATQQQARPDSAKMAEAARDTVPDKPHLGPGIESTPGEKAKRASQKKLATGGRNSKQRQNTSGNNSIDTKNIQLPTRIMQP